MALQLGLDRVGRTAQGSINSQDGIGNSQWLQKWIVRSVFDEPDWYFSRRAMTSESGSRPCES